MVATALKKVTSAGTLELEKKNCLQVTAVDLPKNYGMVLHTTNNVFQQFLLTIVGKIGQKSICSKVSLYQNCTVCTRKIE